MYVTKTCANLTTYSRKAENYNGTIIFEIESAVSPAGKKCYFGFDSGKKCEL